MSEKIEGMKDDLDILALVKAFDGFKDNFQLICDKADKIIVDLPFESTYDAKTHYSFKQDENLAISGIGINPNNKKIVFSVVFGANDKNFYIEDSELIQAYHTDEVTGSVSKRDLKSQIDECFHEHFSGEIKIGSITALQAMVRNNPPLVEILNDTAAYIEATEGSKLRAMAYTSLEGFGTY